MEFHNYTEEPDAEYDRWCDAHAGANQLLSERKKCVEHTIKCAVGFHNNLVKVYDSLKKKKLRTKIHAVEIQSAINGAKKSLGLLAEHAKSISMPENAGESDHITAILAKIAEFASDESKWIAAEYDALRKLEADTKAGGAGKNDMENIGRCERRAERFAEQLEKNLGRLISMLPEKNERLSNVHEKLVVFTRSVLRQTSRYRGGLRTEYEALRSKKSSLERASHHERLDHYRNMIDKKTADDPERRKHLMAIFEQKQKRWEEEKRSLEGKVLAKQKELLDTLSQMKTHTNGLQVELEKLKNPAELLK